MIQIFESDIFKVLAVLSLAPGRKFQRKELKMKTMLNNVNLDLALNKLQLLNIIKKENRFLFLNLEHSKDLIRILQEQYKRLKELPLQVYFSIYDLVDYLSKFKNINVYLFGSYSKLIFNENSDIDIAIISNNLNKSKIESRTNKITKRYGKKIEIHYFGNDFYKNKKDILIKDILRNGERLL